MKGRSPVRLLRSDPPGAAVPPRARVFTAMDLSHVAPGPRLAAENSRMIAGLLFGLPVSLGLWVLLFLLAVG